METEGGFSSVESDGFTIDSSHASQEELEETFAPETPEEEPKKSPKKRRSEAASELGKAGGKASAKARKEAKVQEEAEEEPAEEPEEKPQKAAKSEEAEEEPAKEAKESDEGSSGDEKEAASAESGEQADEQSESAEGTEEEKPLGKPRSDPRARVQQATRQAAEAKRERDEALSQLANFRKEVAELMAARPDQPQARSQNGEDAEPQEDNYDDYKEFLRDFVRWEYRQEEKNRLERQVAEKQQAQAQQSFTVFREGMLAVKDQLSQDVTSLVPVEALQNEPPTGSNWLASILMFHTPENAPTLAVHLSEHPDVFQRIAALTTPHEVSRAVAKLEAKLVSDEAPSDAVTTGTRSERKEVSKAPPPIKPVSGAPFVADGDLLRKDISFGEYFHKANAKWGRFPKR